MQTKSLLEILRERNRELKRLSSNLTLPFNALRLYNYRNKLKQSREVLIKHLKYSKLR